MCTYPGSYSITADMLIHSGSRPVKSVDFGRDTEDQFIEPHSYQMAPKIDDGIEERKVGGISFSRMCQTADF